MRTSLTALFIAAVAVMAGAESDESRLGRIEAQMNSVLNKAGIDFSGSFRSQYFGSTLDENSGDSAVHWGNNRTETNEFTSVDFDIKAHPNEALSARVIFRMHQNWQNFFSDVSNPIFSRWISIDGNVDNMFRFNVGDFRQHYSPLTLWSPDIEIAYEPEIFAAKRREAQNEVFLGNNDRLLQGVNFNMDAEVVPLFNEFHFNALVARLRCGGTKFKNGSAVADNFEVAAMDRILGGLNLDLLMLKGLGIGGTVLKIGDVEPTYDGSLNKAALLARQGLMFAGRLKPSTSIFMDADVFTAALDIEAAFSSNKDTAWYSIDAVSGDTTTMDSSFGLGMAINIGLDGSVKVGENGKIAFNVGFMKNDSLYRNELAQSPTFIGQRIMNVENDRNSGQLYTTFDALYNHVFKFAPNEGNYWTKEPREKLSYVTGIVTPHELDSAWAKGASFFAHDEYGRGDPALQTVLPYGPATPNRVGPKGTVSLSLLDGGIDASVDFAMLSEAKPMAGMEKATFSKVGGGLGLDIAKWATVLNTFKVSFGYSMENMAVKDVSGFTDVKSNNSFMNLGLYYNFWQRFSLLFGYQQIVNDLNSKVLIGTDIIAVDGKVTQSQWAAGLEYKVSNTSKVIARFGNVGAKYPDAIDSFSATQTEVYLNVDF